MEERQLKSGARLLWFAAGASVSALGFWLVNRAEPHWPWDAIEALGVIAGAVGSFAAAAVAVYIAAQARLDQNADREELRRGRALVLATKLRPVLEAWLKVFAAGRYVVSASSPPRFTDLARLPGHWRIFDFPKELAGLLDQVDDLGSAGHILLNVRTEAYEGSVRIEELGARSARDGDDQFLEDRINAVEKGIQAALKYIRSITDQRGA